MIEDVLNFCRIALVNSTTDKGFLTCAAVLSFGAIAVQLARHQLQQQYVSENPSLKKGSGPK